MIALLELIAHAAAQRQDLTSALAASELPQAAELAVRLRAGATLVEALADRLDPQLRNVLAGPRPNLAEAALFVSEELRLRQVIREESLAALAHPLGTVLVVGGTCLSFLIHEGQVPELPWLFAAGGLLILAMLPLLALLPGLGRRFPVLAGAGLHGALARRYARGALVARWQLTEAQVAGWFGGELACLGPLLARAGAELHLRRLAEHHRRAAISARRRLAVISGAMLYLGCGALLVATARGPIGETLGALMASLPY